MKGQSITRSVERHSKGACGRKRDRRFRKGRIHLLLRLDADLVDLWPEFARDEQTVGFGVIGNPVEDGIGVVGAVVTINASEIDPAENPTSDRLDACDQVGLPDVRVDLTFDEFELIESPNQPPVVTDFGSSYLIKGL